MIVKQHVFTALHDKGRGSVRWLVRHPRVGVLLMFIVLIEGVTTAALCLTLGTPQPVQAGAACEPAGAYTLPTPLDLNAASDGITIKDDGVTTYSVGGTSASAIRSALDSCAPRFDGASKTGEYLAYTSYAVDWNYSVVHDGSYCRLSGVKVGLHLNQVMPALNGFTPSDVRTKWATFMTGLVTHENGHKIIDRSQADALLAALEGLHAPCPSISAQAEALTNNALMSLIAANATHDTLTDYGRTQGASW